jgi:hypothetical protein
MITQHMDTYGLKRSPVAIANRLLKRPPKRDVRGQGFRRMVENVGWQVSGHDQAQRWW